MTDSERVLPRDATVTDADPIADYLSEVQSRVQRGVCDCPDTQRLLAAVGAVLVLAAAHEHGATRWEDPLPVPTWIPEIREAISRALLASRA